ncbi:MAG: DNA topoisomerase VI, partial [Methanomassiliicoccales archaeon]
MRSDAPDPTKQLHEIASSIYKQLEDGEIPRMVLPLRTKSNIRFDSRAGVWKYGRATGVRSAKKTVGAYMLLRTMYMLDFISTMIKESKSSTLREMYYISEGWG